MNSFNAVLVQIKFRHTVALWYLRSSLHRPLLPLPSPNTHTERTVNYGSTRCRRVGTASPDNGLLETERTDHLEDITLIHTSQTSASGSETTTTISLTTGPNILQTLQWLGEVFDRITTASRPSTPTPPSTLLPSLSNGQHGTPWPMTPATSSRPHLVWRDVRQTNGAGRHILNLQIDNKFLPRITAIAGPFWRENGRSTPGTVMTGWVSGWLGWRGWVVVVETVLK